MISVVDGNIIRGHQPSAEELGYWDIHATLDLEGTAPGDGSPLVEAMMCDTLGVRVWPHPAGGFLAPSVGYLTAAVTFLRRQKIANVTTMVHCRHGVDRTGMVIASYRILAQGWAPKDAAKECLRNGMHLVYLPWLIQLWRLR